MRYVSISGIVLLNFFLAGTLFSCRSDKRLHHSVSFVSSDSVQQHLIEMYERNKSCREAWVEGVMRNEYRIRVLLFDRMERLDKKTTPNLILGILQDQDTVAVVDKSFQGNMDAGDVVQIVPEVWSESDKSDLVPVCRVYLDRARANLYCSVKKVYYGRIHTENAK